METQREEKEEEIETKSEGQKETQMKRNRQISRDRETGGERETKRNRWGRQKDMVKMMERNIWVGGDGWGIERDSKIRETE